MEQYLSGLEAHVRLALREILEQAMERSTAQSNVTFLLGRHGPLRKAGRWETGRHKRGRRAILAPRRRALERPRETWLLRSASLHELRTSFARASHELRTSLAQCTECRKCQSFFFGAFRLDEYCAQLSLLATQIIWTEVGGLRGLEGRSMAVTVQ